MYIMTPNVFLEIVDDFGNPVKDGVLGHVIVTNLNGFGTPLIRYRIGDLAIKLPKDQYPGDRKLQLPLLQKVIGRDTDIIKTPKGKILVVHSFTGFFEHRREIAQFQVIQNELESLIVRIVPLESLDDVKLNNLRLGLQEIIDEDLNITFEIVSSILPSPSGKPQIVINNFLRN